MGDLQSRLNVFLVHPPRFVRLSTPRLLETGSSDSIWQGRAHWRLDHRQRPSHASFPFFTGRARRRGSAARRSSDVFQGRMPGGRRALPPSFLIHISHGPLDRFAHPLSACMMLAWLAQALLLLFVSRFVPRFDAQPLPVALAAASGLAPHPMMQRFGASVPASLPRPSPPEAGPPGTRGSVPEKFLLCVKKSLSMPRKTRRALLL